MSLKNVSTAASSALSRRRFLGLAGVGIVAGSLAHIRRAEAKTAKNAAQYQDSPNGDKNCANCKLFVAESNECRVVEGEISANAYCRFWVRK